MGLGEAESRRALEKGSRCSPLGSLESWIVTFSSVRKMSSAECWLRSPKKIWRDGGGKERERGKEMRRLAPCILRAGGCGWLGECIEAVRVPLPLLPMLDSECHPPVHISYVQPIIDL